MKLNDPRHPWSRLTAAARLVRDERDVVPPYGFSTRIVALACAQERKVSSLLDRFALRAVAVSCLLALLGVAINYTALTAVAPASTAMDDFMLPTRDPVAVALDLTE